MGHLDVVLLGYVFPNGNTHRVFLRLYFRDGNADTFAFDQLGESNPQIQSSRFRAGQSGQILIVDSTAVANRQSFVDDVNLRSPAGAVAIGDGVPVVLCDRKRDAVPIGVRANVGMALDGDGDRVVMVDADGELVDGDQLLYVLVKDRVEQNSLKGPVVGTVMTNLGLELALGKLGVDFRRASVGDRYVLAMLKEHGGVLGGETSGHLLCLDKTTTGDGLVIALQIFSIMKRTGRSLKELVAGMPQLPQTTLSVAVADHVDPHSEPVIRDAITAAETQLGDRGRVVLRASGTERVIRVMVEGEDRDLVAELAQHLADSVRTTLST